MTNFYFKPKPSNTYIVQYQDRSEISYGFITKSIVALANSDGGKIYLGKKRKSTYGQTISGGIPESLKLGYKQEIEQIIAQISDHVKDFPNNVIDIGWEPNRPGYDYLVIYVQSYNKTLLELNWPEKKLFGIFVRENANTIKYASPTVSIIALQKRLKYKTLKPIKQLNGTAYHLINNEKPLKYAYKYMSLDTFLLSLSSGTWQFVEPTRWSDEYEGRFYKANYNNIAKTGVCPRKLYATCITGEVANEAAWKVYSHGQGLGARCVQIKINMEILRQKLSKDIFKQNHDGSLEKVKGNLYEGMMFYDFTNEEITSLHLPTSPYHETFFEDFCIEKFLKLLLIKRKAYEYEKEIRLFFVPEEYSEIDSNTRKGKGCSVEIRIDWNSIIEEIRVDKCCSKGEMEAIYLVCEKAGLIYRKAKTPGRRKKGEIPIILFNVDEMEGKRKIIIK